MFLIYLIIETCGVGLFIRLFESLQLQDLKSGCRRRSGNYNRIGRAERTDVWLDQRIDGCCRSRDQSSRIRKCKTRSGLDKIETEASSIAFVAEEEVQLVLDDRTADTAAKLVERQFALFYPRCDVVKKIACIERITAEILEKRTVKFISAALGDNADLAARSGAEFGRKVRRVNTKFLYVL